MQHTFDCVRLRIGFSATPEDSREGLAIVPVSPAQKLCRLPLPSKSTETQCRWLEAGHLMTCLHTTGATRWRPRGRGVLCSLKGHRRSGNGPTAMGWYVTVLTVSAIPSGSFTNRHVLHTASLPKYLENRKLPFWVVFYF